MTNTKLARLFLGGAVAYAVVTSAPDIWQELFGNARLSDISNYYPQSFIAAIPFYIAPFILALISELIGDRFDNGKGSLGRLLRNGFKFLAIAACMIPLVNGIHHLIHGLPPDVQEWANTLGSNARRYRHRAGASYLRLFVRFWGPITIIIYGGTIRFIIEQWLRIYNVSI